MPYRKPLLKEIVAEVHLGRDSLKPAAFIAAANALVTAGYADVEFIPVGTVSISPDAMATAHHVRLRCWSPGRTRCVQLGPDMIVVNHADLYPGKAAFLELVSDVLRLLAPVVDVQTERVAIVTIDELRHDGQLRLGDWFRCDELLAPVMADATAPVQAVTQWEQGTRSLALSMQYDGVQTVVVLQCSLSVMADAPLKSVAELLGASAVVFRKLITPRTVEYMGGEL